MQFYSTNNKKNRLSLKKAVLKGLADDKGLFMPEKIPPMPKNFVQNINNYSIKELAFEIVKPFCADDIPYKDLQQLVSESINFEIPLIQLDEEISILELWHGPTLAFKDVGARFMARLLAYFSQKDTKETYVLVATSGDTGSAVANGFLNVPGIKVIILYPKGGVSKIQEQQLTTLGNNITALEIEGTFDDCQRLVKSAFLDLEINERLTLTSANSINIARLLPQAIYYFVGYSQLKDKSGSIVYSVPSGNFGNLTAGLIAGKMGLPFEKYIAATNINCVVPEYLKEGVYKPRPSYPTISNAMDVGDPSNFARMLEIYEQSVDKMREDIVGYSFSDDMTKQAMQEIYQKYNYVIDPHGAVGYLGLLEYIKENKDKDKKKKKKINGLILETAHPAKFYDIVRDTLNIEIPLPELIENCLKKEKAVIEISSNYEDFKEYLMQLN